MTADSPQVQQARERAEQARYRMMDTLQELQQKIVTGPGYQVPFAEAVKKATGMVTMAVGLITEPAQAEEIVASGRADLVALARGLLNDPFWAWRAADEQTYGYDLHATTLHLLGIDHEKLTYHHNGIDRRLTDVHGHVIREILA